MNIEKAIDQLVEGKNQFEDEISTLAEMITDCESHGIDDWAEYFKDDVERIRHSILKNPKQFLKELMIAVDETEGWRYSDVKEIKRVFGLK